MRVVLWVIVGLWVVGVVVVSYLVLSKRLGVGSYSPKNCLGGKLETFMMEKIRARKFKKVEGGWIYLMDGGSYKLQEGGDYTVKKVIDPRGLMGGKAGSFVVERRSKQEVLNLLFEMALVSVGNPNRQFFVSVPICPPNEI